MNKTKGRKARIEELEQAVVKAALHWRACQAKNEHPEKQQRLHNLENVAFELMRELGVV